MASPASDDTYYTARTQSDNQVHDIAHYQLNSTNTWIESIWKLKYEGIDRANLTIDGICGMTGYAENTRLKALEAEACFLRAFLAFDLVRYWGDVPCLLYTSDAADEEDSVDIGGRRIIEKKKTTAPVNGGRLDKNRHRELD